MRLARILAVCVVLAALVFALAPRKKAGPPAAPLAYPGEVLGVTANSLDADTAAVQDHVNQLGAGWIREEFRWPTLEPTRGRFDFRRYDGLMTVASNHGLHVLPVLFQSPQWVSSQPNRLPTRLADWRQFVKSVIARYGNGGTFWRTHPQFDGRLAPSVWEIWNEPYLRVFDDLGPRPRQYAELVRATAQAGRAVDPKARFLTASETTYVAKNGANRNWLRDVDAGVPGFGAWVDLLAVHPYSVGDPFATDVPRSQQLRRIDDLEQTLEDVGIGRRPMWLTELGWSTCTASACVSPAQQADYWRKALAAMASDYRGRVAAVFAYRLADIDAGGPGDAQSGFGLLTQAGRRKPAWSVVREAADQTG